MRQLAAVLAPALHLLALCSLAFVGVNRPWAAGPLRPAAPQGRVIVEAQPGSSFPTGARDPDAFVFSPDGRALMLTTDTGHTARLWDVGAGRVKATLTSRTGGLVTPYFSAGGRLVAFTAGKQIELWDITAGRPRFKAVQGGPVYSLDFSPDGLMLATADPGARAVRLWSVEAGGLAATLPLPAGESGTPVVGFSPDGHTLAVRGENVVYLYDAATRRLRAALRGHRSTVYAFAFSPDSRALATASADGTAKLWDVGAGSLRATLVGHEWRVNRVAFSPDGRRLATADRGGVVKLWEVETGGVSATLAARGTKVNLLLFAPDGLTLATSRGEVMEMWDAATGRLKARFGGALWPAAFTPDGRTLATRGRGNTVLLWEVRR